MIRYLFLWTSPLGCTTVDDSDPVEPSFIEVEGAVQDADDGSLVFSNEARSIAVTATTLDRDAEPYAYNGWVEVTARPGTIHSVEGATPTTDSWGETRWYLPVTDGAVSTTVSMASAFGDARVWMTAVGDPEDGGRGGSMATGVTESIPIDLPTIPDLQDVTHLEIDRPYTDSPLSGEFVTVRTEDRWVVVTELTTNGFWVSDLGPDDEPPAEVGGEYRGLYIYTFNKPEGIAVGDRLKQLAGGVQEYVGTTQISYPIYKPMEGDPVDPPAAAVLPVEGTGQENACSNDTTPNNMLLEAYESSLVTIPVATIPANFKDMPPGEDAHEDYANFAEYWQWPVDLPGGCKFMVVSNTVVPEFDPVANAGETVGPITGLLKYVRAMGDRWIVVVRGPEDMPFVDTDSEPSAAAKTRSIWPLPEPASAHTPLCDHTHVGDHLGTPKE